MSNYKNISFYDLMQIEEFKQAAKNNNKEVMDKVLWEAGMDTTQDYEIVDEVLHRPMTTNMPWKGPYVMGFGRTDPQFLNSGFARIEDIIQSSKDVSLREELLSLNPRDTSDWTEEHALECEIPDDDGDEWSDFVEEKESE